MRTRRIFVCVLVSSACSREPELVAVRIEQPDLPRAVPATALPSATPAPQAPVLPRQAPPVPLLTQEPGPEPMVEHAPADPAYDKPSLDAWLARARRTSDGELSHMIAGLSQATPSAWPHTRIVLESPLPGTRNDLKNLRPRVDALAQSDESLEHALLRLLAIESFSVAAPLRPLLRELIVRQALLSSLRLLGNAPSDERAQAVALAAELGSLERPWFGATARASIYELGQAAVPALHGLARASDASPAAHRRATWAAAVLDRLGFATPDATLAALRDHPQRATELIEVLAATPDPGVLRSLLTLVDDPQSDVRQASCRAVERIVASGALAERTAHRVLELSAQARLGAPPANAKLLSAAQLWHTLAAALAENRRHQLKESIDVALAEKSDSSSRELLALLPNDAPSERYAAIASELALRAEAAALSEDRLFAAQLARKAAVFATDEAFQTRLRDRAYGILSPTNDSDDLPSARPVKGSALPLRNTMALSAIGATFLLTLLRRRSRS